MFVCRGVDSLDFRAVWILSTRLLSVVKFVLRCSGLFVCSGAMGGPFGLSVSGVVIVVVIGIVRAQVSSTYKPEVEPLGILP